MERLKADTDAIYNCLSELRRLDAEHTSEGPTNFEESLVDDILTLKRYGPFFYSFASL